MEDEHLNGADDGCSHPEWVKEGYRRKEAQSLYYERQTVGGT